MGIYGSRADGDGGHGLSEWEGNNNLLLILAF